MRRIVSVLALAVVAALFHVVPAPAVAAGLGAAPPIVGQLVDYTTGNPVAGTTLRLHVDSVGSPAAGAVASAVTDANGEFTIAPPSAAQTYWVEVVRNAWVQAGYVRDYPSGPSWVQFDEGDAAAVAPGTRLGRVMAVPSYISGVVVNAATGDRLPGINVSTRDVLALGTVLNSDVTDSNGFFRIPIWGEDFGLRVNGRARGFENGWRACNGGVVPTWGAACQSPIGRIGKVRLDRR